MASFLRAFPHFFFYHYLSKQSGEIKRDGEHFANKSRAVSPLKTVSTALTDRIQSGGQTSKS